MIRAPDLIALRDGAVYRPIVKASAAKDAVRAFADRGTAVGGDGADILRIGVLAPLPDVARHVVEAELVRGLCGHHLGVLTAPPVVPSHAVDVVTAAEAKSVTPVRAAT